MRGPFWYKTLTKSNSFSRRVWKEVEAQLGCAEDATATACCTSRTVDSGTLVKKAWVAWKHVLLANSPRQYDGWWVLLLTGS